MNATERKVNQPISFKARDDNERQVARLVRLMLQYWTLRTMIERARQQNDPVSELMVDCTKRVRVQGFRDEFNSTIPLAPGQPIFDDEKLQQAGTRIAYLLPTARANFAVGEPDRAADLLEQVRTIEEEIVTLEVNRALYGISYFNHDLQDLSIAA
jgi:hypothetical protein